MGLLDSVIGAISGSQAGSAPGGNAALLNAVIGMLGNDAAGGGVGGLSGLVLKFQQSGLGDVVGSWISQGNNLPISADQLHSVLGSDTVAQLAQQLGLSHGDVTSQLAQLLPHLVDRLTPDGQIPEGGLSGAKELFARLAPQ